MRTFVAVLVAAVWLGTATAAQLAEKVGTLATFTGTGNGANYISPEGADAVLFIYSTTGGATLSLEVSTDGVTWADVTDSAAAITAGTNTPKSVSNPIGLYRAVCDAHSSGTHTVKFRYFSTSR
jgi:hypothetical protein